MFSLQETHFSQHTFIPEIPIPVHQYVTMRLKPALISSEALAGLFLSSSESLILMSHLSLDSYATISHYNQCIVFIQGKKERKKIKLKKSMHAFG